MLYTNINEKETRSVLTFSLQYEEQPFGVGAGIAQHRAKTYQMKQK